MTDTRIATCDEVLKELRIFYAHETGRSLTVCDSLISPEMSVEQLMRIESDLDWMGFYQHFGIPCPESLIGTLTAQSTVRDFAHYLAGQIEVPIPRPVTILGKPCLSAGLFLEIKSQLIQKGERENEISPSSNIEPFLVRHHDLFRKVRWYAPGKLSALKIRNRFSEWGCLSLVGVIIASFLSGPISNKLGINSGALFAMLIASAFCSLLCLFVGIKYRETFERASFDGISDFRSLIDALLNRPASDKRRFNQSVCGNT